MYRVLILVSAFLLAITGMLYLQGGNRDAADMASAAPILTAVETLSAPGNSPAQTHPSAGANALAAIVAAANAPAPAAQDNSLQSLTSGVLANLGVATGASPTQDDPMAAMTANVLAGLGSAPRPNPPTQAGNLQGIVVQALREGQSDTYIDALLNEAASAGQVQVPEALMTAEGRVDTNTLLASIVAQATAETDALASQLAAEAQGIAAATPRPATASAQGPRLYTVEAGDSLAYISVVFYGTPAGYARIFDANRDKISSPNMIRVGQELLIPG